MHYSQALDNGAAHTEGLAPMTRASRCEFILGVLTPILAVIGVMFLLFAPLYTVNAPNNEGTVVAQHLSASYLSHGNIFSQYIPLYAGVFLLTLVIATSAVVHARTQARAAAVVLWISSALLWIGTYPISGLWQTSYFGVLGLIGSFLGVALASAFLACAIAIAVDVRRHPNHG
jgi:hypothetical protein